MSPDAGAPAAPHNVADPFELLKSIDLSSIDKQTLGDLRTDHAGETGAVFIYRGILAISREEKVRAFSEEHLATESEHLALVEAILPPGQRSRLIPIWRIAGWLTGALPALFGPRAVFKTIEAVETFVDVHYQEQIDYLSDKPQHAALTSLLKICQADEVHHRDEARAFAGGDSAGPFMSLWAWLVGAGSKAAVGAARVI
ncbi:MAG: demethoxyubiquinone hydroxylase family protein [Pseudomonadota bacterium]